MQKSSTSECTRRSKEEDEELQRSTKKVKEVHNAVGAHDEPLPTAFGNTGKSFRDKLLGDIPGAYKQAFDFERDMEMEYLSDMEAQVYPDGEAEVRLSGESKTRIRSQLSNALIIKVFGKSVGYQFLHSRILGLWKPVSKMDCVHLGRGYFLIRFAFKADHDKVLSGGPWFVGGHFLAIRRWELNFRPSRALEALVAVWIRLLELPFEYYEGSVL
nr:hypothetical protein CFP56_51197 [Quercus suber]